MSDIYQDAMERLAKWRSVFAGWQLGTRANDDPECAAVRDHREVTILLRAEVNALTRIILEKKLVSQEELARVMAEEAEHLNAAYEKKFPGFKARSDGISMDVAMARETTRGWRP